jgi:hypothetical protein
VRELEHRLGIKAGTKPPRPLAIAKPNARRAIAPVAGEQSYLETHAPELAAT